MTDQPEETEAEMISAQAYQVIGYLDEVIAGGAPKPSSEAMIRALDYFCAGQYDEEFLPWPNTIKEQEADYDGRKDV
jgi:hypothetical protein